MKTSRNKINLIAIFAVGIGIQVYYKTKFFLLGQFAISDLWHWLTLVELSFGFLLSALVVLGHDRIVRQLKSMIPKRSKLLTRLSIQVLITSIYAIIASYLFSIFFWNVILKIPMTSEYLFDFIVLSLFIPLFVNGLTESLYYYGEWEAESRKKEQLEKENIKARYEILKNQISPHFLFNCFNTLAVLIDEGKKNASTFLKQLSKVYRFVLDTKESEIIRLKEELRVFHAYAHLLSIRFGENFNLENRIESRQEEFYIAPLTMQILLENAIKHNRSSIDHPLKVDISINGKHLIFTNNLAPVAAVESTSTGLQNIKSRYQFLTGEQVTIEHTKEHFSVKVPLISVSSI